MRAAVEGNAEDRGAAVRQVVRLRNAHEGEGTDEEIVVVDIMPAAVHLPPASFIQRAQNTTRRARPGHGLEPTILASGYSCLARRRRSARLSFRHGERKSLVRGKNGEVD